MWWFTGVKHPDATATHTPWLQILFCATLSVTAVGFIQGAAVRRERRRRQALQSALKKTEVRFRRLYDHAADAFFVHDISGKLIDVNRRAVESLGYTRQELLQLSVSDIEVGVLPEKVAEVWSRMTPGVTQNLDGLHRRKDGSTFPVEIRIRLVLSEGRPLLLALARDRTERLRAEETVRSTEARYRRHFELGYIGMAITSVEMDWLEVNDSLCNTLGYAREELLKLTWADLTHPDDLAADVGLFSRVLDADIDEYALEKRFIRKDDQVIHAAISVRCERRADGSVDYLVALVQDITERKRAEHAMARQAKVIDQIRDSVISLDLSGVIRSWNKGAQRLFGYTLDQALGRHISMLYPESDRSSVLRQVIEPAINNGSYEAVVPMHKADGQHLFAHLSLSLVKDPRGAVTGLIAYALDVTKRKQAENALRASLNLLETLLDTIPSPVFYKDTSGIYQRCNAAFAEQIIGLPRDQILGKSLFDLSDAIPHDLAKVYHDADLALMREPGTQFYEAQVRCADGVRRDYFFYKATFNNAAGKVDGMVGLMLDLTELKRTERRLKTRLHYEECVAACSEELLSDAPMQQVLTHATRHLLDASAISRVYVFENFHDPDVGLCARQIVEVCADGVITAIDDPALQHLPYTLFPESFRQHLASGIRFEAKVADLPDETRALLEPFDIKSFLVLPIQAGGKWHGFIGFDEYDYPGRWSNEDIRLLETAARMISAYIDRKRADRKLTDAKEAAEAATHVKSQFLANMSHEIRTPMTAILGYTDLLLEKDIDPIEQVRCIDTIRRNGQHLLAVIDDILDLSKIEAGKLLIEQVPCRLADVVFDVTRLMRPRALAKHLTLSVRQADGVPTSLVTDPTRLRQVLLNLLSNAVKFTSQGKVELEVSLRNAVPAADAPTTGRATVGFRVIDTGIGITSEQRSKLFQPFTQADPTMSRRFGGTGLGLAISRRLAELLGGDITCGANPNGGSWFELTITGTVVHGPEDMTPDHDTPLVQVAGSEPSTQTVEVPTALESDDNATPAPIDARILLAEDGLDNQLLISKILTKAGAEVTVADNGRIAAEKAIESLVAGRPFDLILMDMQMPQLDGYEATELLRGRMYSGPIVALTAHAMTGDRRKCIDAGCDDYATKPIKKADLIALVQQYITPPHSPTDPAGANP